MRMCTRCCVVSYSRLDMNRVMTMLVCWHAYQLQSDLTGLCLQASTSKPSATAVRKSKKSDVTGPDDASVPPVASATPLPATQPAIQVNHSATESHRSARCWYLQTEYMPCAS